MNFRFPNIKNHTWSKIQVACLAWLLFLTWPQYLSANSPKIIPLDPHKSSIHITVFYQNKAILMGQFSIKKGSISYNNIHQEINVEIISNTFKSNQPLKDSFYKSAAILDSQKHPIISLIAVGQKKRLQGFIKHKNIFHPITLQLQPHASNKQWQLTGTLRNSNPEQKDYSVEFSCTFLSIE